MAEIAALFKSFSVIKDQAKLKVLHDYVYIDNFGNYIKITIDQQVSPSLLVIINESIIFQSSSCTTEQHFWCFSYARC